MNKVRDAEKVSARIPGLIEVFFGRLANLCRARRQERRRGRRTLQFQSLEPRVLLSADLVGSVHWDPGEAALFPGADAEAVVRVENIGDATAKSAKVSVYASADDVLDASDILLGKDKIHGKLKPGAVQEVEVDLDFDTSLFPGEYRLIALVDSTDRVHEQDESNNAALGPVFDFSWMFGDLPGHHGSNKLTFVDEDGTKVKFRLHGPGTGELTWDGSGWDLLVTGTDERSVLSIQANGRGDGRFALDDVHVAGPLAAIFAPRTDLTGTLATEDALGAGLLIGSATNAIIAVPTITGLGGHKFGLQGIAVLGDLENSQILIGADFGADGQPGGEGDDADTYGAGELGKLLIGGSMLSSEVRVGQDPVDGIFDNGNDAFHGGEESSIDAIFIRGDMSDDSLVVAGALPFKAFVDHHKIRVADDPRFRLHDADVNDPPDALDDNATTDEDTAVTVDVLANDTDADGDSLTVQSVGAAANGGVVLNADGTVTYTPDPDFFGADSFAYTISDGNGGTDTATVSVEVNPVNDPPVLDPIGDRTVLEGGTLVFQATASDVDDLPGALSFSLDAGAPLGATIDPATGEFSWTPAAPGDYQATVRVADDDGAFDLETIAITVFALPAVSVGDVAVLEGDAGTTLAQFAVSLSAPAPVDLSVDYFTLNGTAVAEQDFTTTAGTLFISAGGTGGVVEVPIIGDLLVEPDETFQLRLSNPVNATIADEFGDGTILNDDFNQAPDALDDPATTDEDVAVTVDVLANDTDPDGDSLTVQSVGAAANGSVVINVDNTVTYTPDPNFFGADSFTYTISDGQGGTDTATVTLTVNPVNDPPAALDDSASTDEDSAVLIDVLSNDSDVDGDALTVLSLDGQAPVVGTPIALASGALVTPQTDGTYLYDPNGAFESLGTGDSAADSFTYSIGDGLGGVDSAVATVTVNGVNDMPVLDPIGTIYSLANDAFTYQVAASDPDDAPGGLTFSLVGPAVPNASISASGLFEWTVTPALFGTTTFTVHVEDSGGLSDEQAFDVTVIAPPRMALDDAMVVEGVDADAVFRVLLSGPAPIQGVSVDYANTGVFGAQPNVDFTPVSGTVNFAHGETETTFSVPILDNSDTNDEIFQYTLSNAVNADLGTYKPSAIGTILDNDGAIHLGIDRETVFEGDGEPVTALFRVLLTSDLHSGVTVNYTTGIGGGANPGTDFVAETGTVTFAAGETVQIIDIEIVGDTIAELTEQFTVQLSGASGATISGFPGALNAFIVDDDAPGLLVAASEGSGASAGSTPDATELQATLDAAIDLWTGALGAGDPRLAQLDGLTIAVTDMAGTGLGATAGSTILIDSDAAGHGWFVDLTPDRNEEFRLHADAGALAATPRSEAFGQMDLLTVVMHEIGHVLGFDHEDAERYAVMRDSLDAGTRYTLAAPKFDLDMPWAGGTHAGIAWNAWGGDWVTDHKPRAWHGARHFSDFLVRL